MTWTVNGFYCAAVGAQPARSHRELYLYHFNADPQRPTRLISVINRIYKACGLNELEQIEDAPEYRPNVVVTSELVESFLKVKETV